MVGVLEGVLVEIKGAFSGVGLKYLISHFIVVWGILQNYLNQRNFRLRLDFKFKSATKALTGVGSADPKAES